MCLKADKMAIKNLQIDPFKSFETNKNSKTDNKLIDLVLNL